MPRVRLTKRTIDALPTPDKDAVHWDKNCPGFGLKVTPKGRKVFIVLYRTADGRLRKFTIGPHGRVTLHQARLAAQRIFAARLEGRDPAAEKQSARHRIVVDRLDSLAAAYVNEHLARTRRGKEVARVLQREFVSRWGQRSIHELQKREIMELVMLAMARGTPVAANKLLKIIKAFLSWCVGRAILEVSPAQGLKAPYKEEARDRVLSDMELASVLVASASRTEISWNCWH